MQRVNVLVTRPSHWLQFVTMDRPGSFSIFSDGKKQGSDFPSSRISIHYHYSRHVILSNNQKERWVFSDIRIARLDLGVFSPDWTGCFILIQREDHTSLSSSILCGLLGNESAAGSNDGRGVSNEDGCC